jgi:hypothetical protein
MNDEAILRERGRIDADPDIDHACRAASGHYERVIDESVEETFPASDATTPVRPGSLASEGYSRSALSLDRGTSHATTVLAVFLGAAALGFVVGLALGRGGLLRTLRWR